MTTRQATFRFDKEDLRLLEDLAISIGVSRTQVIRRAIRSMAAARSRDRDGANKLLAKLRTGERPDATITIVLDDNLTAVLTVDDKQRKDLRIITSEVKLSDGQGYEADYFKIYLADATGDGQVLLGFMPQLAWTQLSGQISALGGAGAAWGLGKA